MLARLRLRVRTHLRECTSVCVFARLFACVRACLHMCVRVCMCARAFACVRARLRVCVRVCVFCARVYVPVLANRRLQLSKASRRHHGKSHLHIAGFASFSGETDATMPGL